jgi:hypothetical protein
VHYARTVYGYHGCSATTAEGVLGGALFKHSENAYDWLGAGVYFWEYGLDRAWRWAEEHWQDEPAVVGAHIQLGNCFDLLDTRFTDILKELAPIYAESIKATGGSVPQNKGKQLKLRFLDCAVVNWSLKFLEKEGQTYQSVRCAFLEGDSVYDDGAGAKSEIFLETHIQIAVRDHACILGTFRPPGAP